MAERGGDDWSRSPSGSEARLVELLADAAAEGPMMYSVDANFKFDLDMLEDYAIIHDEECKHEFDDEAAAQTKKLRFEMMDDEVRSQNDPDDIELEELRRVVEGYKRASQNILTVMNNDAICDEAFEVDVSSSSDGDNEAMKSDEDSGAENHEPVSVVDKAGVWCNNRVSPTFIEKRSVTCGTQGTCVAEERFNSCNKFAAAGLGRDPRITAQTCVFQSDDETGPMTLPKRAKLRCQEMQRRLLDRADNRSANQPGHERILLVGLADSGKSSLVDSLTAALGGDWYPRYRGPIHGLPNKDYKKYAYRVPKYLRGPMFDDITMLEVADLPGFADEECRAIEEVIRLSIAGHDHEAYQPLLETVNLGKKHGIEAMWKFFSPKCDMAKISRVVFVQAASDPLPRNLLKSVMAACKAGPNQERDIPVYGVMTKMDQVLPHCEKFVCMEQEFILALGLDSMVNKHHKYHRLTNYTLSIMHDVSSHFLIDEPILELVRLLTEPLTPVMKDPLQAPISSTKAKKSDLCSKEPKPISTQTMENIRVNTDSNKENNDLVHEIFPENKIIVNRLKASACVSWKDMKSSMINAHRAMAMVWKSNEPPTRPESFTWENFKCAIIFIVKWLFFTLVVIPLRIRPVWKSLNHTAVDLWRFLCIIIKGLWKRFKETMTSKNLLPMLHFILFIMVFVLDMTPRKVDTRVAKLAPAYEPPNTLPVTDTCIEGLCAQSTADLVKSRPTTNFPEQELRNPNKEPNIGIMELDSLQRKEMYESQGLNQKSEHQSQMKNTESKIKYDGNRPYILQKRKGFLYRVYLD